VPGAPGDALRLACDYQPGDALVFGRESTGVPREVTDRFPDEVYGEIELALEPFRQVPTTRRAGGTGLGLPLTKALVEANRAAMSITSVKKEGTLVEITFPPQRVLAG
jgi:signal transduction histidine kinase